MLGTHKLIVDEWAEIWDLLHPYADEGFWQWPSEFDPSARYIVGRVLLAQHREEITALADQYPGRIIFSNPAEGSETILYQLRRLQILTHVMDGRIGLIASGDVEPLFDYCKTDCYFTNIVDYTENQQCMPDALAQHAGPRPYNFLFLNGRLRPHRKYLIDQFRGLGLLDRALWSNLESRVTLQVTSRLAVGNSEPIQLLPPHYEIERAVPNQFGLPNQGFVKNQLFNNTWGDAIVNPYCYSDTWFSVVTETIFDYPHTFRTEKIWKPILMAHPFVVAANVGYLSDLRAAGFQTFGNFIDESYDQIDCPHSRIQRIIQTVADIVSNGADEFWSATRDICKYNQQRLVEYNREQRALLPQNLLTYLNERS